MKLPENTKPWIQGAAVGAIVCAVVGFAWGGWVFESTANKAAAVAANDAKIGAYASICADRFNAQADAPVKLAELKKVSSWDQGATIGKTPFAIMPGSKTSDSDVARACANLLASAATPK